MKSPYPRSHQLIPWFKTEPERVRLVVEPHGGELRELRGEAHAIQRVRCGVAGGLAVGIIQYIFLYTAYIIIYYIYIYYYIKYIHCIKLYRVVLYDMLIILYTVYRCDCKYIIYIYTYIYISQL